jgi:two-component system cell cycle response regulator
VVGGADDAIVLNIRILPLALGALGGCAGVAAVALSSPALGVVAGAAAVGAGASAALGAAQGDRGEHDRLVAELARTRTELDDALVRARGERDRIAQLTSELDELRAAAAAPQAPTEVDDDAAALTDDVTQLFSEAYFRVALEARIASARRHLRPVAIALLEVAEGLPVPAAAAAPPERAAESIRQTIRDADTACRLLDGTFAIILEDTPENGAVWTVERVRRNLVSRYGSHTMWAGVACYPAHAFSAEELIEQARLALGAAREWKQDRIEVAVAE